MRPRPKHWISTDPMATQLGDAEWIENLVRLEPVLRTLKYDQPNGVEVWEALRELSTPREALSTEG